MPQLYRHALTFNPFRLHAYAIGGQHQAEHDGQHRRPLGDHGFCSLDCCVIPFAFERTPVSEIKSVYVCVRDYSLRCTHADRAVETRACTRDACWIAQMGTLCPAGNCAQLQAPRVRDFLLAAVTMLTVVVVVAVVDQVVDVADAVAKSIYLNDDWLAAWLAVCACVLVYLCVCVCMFMYARVCEIPCLAVYNAPIYAHLHLPSRTKPTRALVWRLARCCVFSKRLRPSDAIQLLDTSTTTTTTEHTHALQAPRWWWW